jgi:hypothetical protein
MITQSIQEKARIRAAKWQKENPERRKEIRAKWIANNMEKMRAIRKAWKIANKEKVLENCKKWMRDHPEVRAANEATRRARKKGAGGKFTKEQISTLYSKQKGMCAICGGSIADKFHRDHIIPIALNGNNDILNIQLLCPTCNTKKGAKHPIDYANQLGKLL